MQNVPPAPHPASHGAACPWADLDEAGSGLELEDFLSFRIVRLASVLQRTLSRSYLEPQGLSASDWRVLALVRRASPVPFGEATERTGIDKGQVSRTVKTLAARGLLALEGDAGHAQRVVLRITPAGRRLHDRILPEAARIQARLLRALPPAQREALWQALQSLQEQLAADAPPPAASRRQARAPLTPPSRRSP